MEVAAAQEPHEAKTEDEAEAEAATSLEADEDEAAHEATAAETVATANEAMDAETVAAANEATAAETDAAAEASPGTQVAIAEAMDAEDEPKESSTDCILDPSQCHSTPKPGSKKKRKKKKKVVVTMPPPKYDADLPDRLSASDIRAAVSKVMPKAQACGPRHGAALGARVRVRLTVAGATGRATESRATGDHAETALGKCVAKALAKARFPRNNKHLTRLMYNVKM